MKFQKYIFITVVAVLLSGCLHEIKEAPKGWYSSGKTGDWTAYQSNQTQMVVDQPSEFSQLRREAQEKVNTSQDSTLEVSADPEVGVDMLCSTPENSLSREADRAHKMVEVMQEVQTLEKRKDLSQDMKNFLGQSLQNRTIDTILALCQRNYDEKGWLTDDCKSRLDKFIEGHPYDFPNITNTEYADILASYFRVNQLPDFKQLPEAERLEQLNLVFEQMAKLPIPLRGHLAKNIFHLDLVTGNVTNHPAARSLKGETVEYDRKWETIGGLGGPDVIIAVPTQANIVLHEIGHAISSLRTPKEYTKKMHEVWENEIAPEYFKQLHRGQLEEAFAEAFSDYFMSKASRKQMRRSKPKLFSFMQKYASLDGTYN
ncbi:MAG: hypothetical protein HY390_05825 [Deltaproteobacteria bacterium]|nr:hypothetical protein [Deltaproteobacteria bacterium]